MNLKLLFIPSKHKQESGMQKFVNVGSASITREKLLLENLGRKLNITISSVSLLISSSFKLSYWQLFVLSLNKEKKKMIIKICSDFTIIRS